MTLVNRMSIPRYDSSAAGLPQIEQGSSFSLSFREKRMARIKVDLHDIYNNSRAIDNALQQAFDDAIEKRIE